MEPQAAFVWADCGVELHAPPSVGSDSSLIVSPWHSKRDDTFWLSHTLEYLHFMVKRFVGDKWKNR
jgi:hypothetical protein